MFVRFICWVTIAAVALSHLQASEPQRVSIEVVEPTGVHRDSSPVHTLLILPHPVSTSTGFRLIQNGKPVVAQFRPGTSDHATPEWWLDFMAGCLPYESRVYNVEYGPDVEPSPEPDHGHRLVERDGSFVVSNAPYIDWTIPRDLSGFLRSVVVSPSEYLRPDSAGLTMTDRDGNTHQLGGQGTVSKVIRNGRMAVALHFEKSETDVALSGLTWSADLTFPGQVSWVQLQLNLDDPGNCIREVGLQLNMNLDPPDASNRTLVEFGASRTVYRSLSGTAQTELRANRRNVIPWEVFRDVSGQLQPFVVASQRSSPAEGWAHIMDRNRCLAIAFDQFGHDSDDRIRVKADGTISASRQFAAEASGVARTQKTWQMWLHFVPFPPQQSANTDPHMMQNPLIVRQINTAHGANQN